MEITEASIGDIKPYETNPRNISQKAVESVAESIQQFGFRQPIVVDADSIVIAGHTRLLAAKHLKLKKVPVHVADLSKEKASAYRLLDNKLNELASWDQGLIDVELEKLSDLDLGLLDLFGELEDGMPAEASAFDDLIADNMSVSYENAGTHGDWVTMSFVMPPEERDRVQEALRNIQNDAGLLNTTQALIKLAKEYV